MLLSKTVDARVLRARRGWKKLRVWSIKRNSAGELVPDADTNEVTRTDELCGESEISDVKWWLFEVEIKKKHIYVYIGISTPTLFTAILRNILLIVI